MSAKTKSRLNKQKEIEQKRRKRRKTIILVIVLLIAIISISTYLFTSDTFKIQEINIQGYVEISQEQILNDSGLNIGDNIFIIPGIVTKVKLKKHGYAEDAKIIKEYPNAITIKIKEREREYQILTESGEYIYIDEQGYLLEHSINKLDLITITGMEVKIEDLEDNKRLNQKDLEKMENVLQIREETKKIGIYDQIEQIDTNEEYKIHLNQDSIIINLGNATNLSNRMDYVKALLKKEEGHAGTIYVNGNINENFTPYFKEK